LLRGTFKRCGLGSAARYRGCDAVPTSTAAGPSAGANAPRDMADVVGHERRVGAPHIHHPFAAKTAENCLGVGTAFRHIARS
jgi:hypothetical protein